MPSLSMALGLSRARAATGSVDPAAAAFFAKAGIGTSVQREAINDLVVALKNADIWGGSKVKALWPFVGGNATAHSKNLIDPNTCNLTFNGAVIQDSNGITGDGSTGYASSSASPDIFFPSGVSWHMAAYLRTQGVADSATRISVAARSTIVTGATQLARYRDATNNLAAISFGPSIPFTTGFMLGMQSSSGTAVVRANGAEASGGITDFTYLPGNITLLAKYDGGFSNLNMALATAGGALTNAERAALESAVVHFQTALGRQV